MLSVAEAESLFLLCAASLGLGAMGAAAMIWARRRLFESILEGVRRKTPVRESSLYDRIRRQAELKPAQRLDLAAFPAVKDDSGSELAPGLKDILLGKNEPEERVWRRVRRLARQVCLGEISTWKSVERELRGLPAAPAADALLAHTTWDEITEPVRAVFFEAARRSSDYEAVKWGIVVGGLKPSRRRIDELSMLGRHPEFAPYCAWLIHHAGYEDPTLRRAIVEMLPVSSQWGTVSVIDQIVNDEELIADVGVQKEVLMYGMENAVGLHAEISFPLATKIDTAQLMSEAANDERLFRRLVDLHHSLAVSRRPYGGLAELPEAKERIEAFLKFLMGGRSGIEALYGLDALRVFFADRSLAWPERSERLDQIVRLWDETFSAERVCEGLSDPERGVFACSLVERYRLRGLRRAVRSRFERSPDASSIGALAAVGGRDDLEAMLGAISRIVDLQWRAKMSRKDGSGLKRAGSAAYACLVKAMGRLATPGAVSLIETALRDYDPAVRRAALTACRELPPSRRSPAIAALLRPPRA